MRTPDIRPASGGASMVVAWRFAGRRVLVVGGGPIAAGRALAALEADAEVVVVSPEVGTELRARHARGEVAWHARHFDETDLHGVSMVLAAVDDAGASERIAGAARRSGIPVNCADRKELCDFYFPSVHRDGPVQVAVTTNGHGPALASRLRKRIASLLPAEVARATRRYGELRDRIRAARPGPSGDARRMAWLSALGRSWPFDRLAALRDDDLRALVDDYLGGGEPPDPPAEQPIPAGEGSITLVGAGPGDPALLTTAAREALDRADLVLADRLVSPEILALVQCELRIATKLPGRADRAQAELDARVVDAVRAGKHVVRLKCGDPFLLGRGGEEVATFAAHGLRTGVVPGITSAFAAPLAAGIPVTTRGVADRVLVTTATGRGGSVPRPPAFDPDTTVVVLMGVGSLARWTAAWREAGWPDQWPVAVVERASRPGEHVVTGTLADIAARAAHAEVAAPAVVVVGRVVELARGAAQSPCVTAAPVSSGARIRTGLFARPRANSGMSSSSASVGRRRAR